MSLNDNKNWVPYHILEDKYEEYLNECYSPVKICGYEYEQGSAWRELDPIGFRCGLYDWLDNELTERRFTLVDDECYEGDLDDDEIAEVRAKN